MRIGACLWSLPEDPHEAAAWAKEAGFEAIDVDPGFAAGWDAEGGLPVASVAIAHLMPDGAALRPPTIRRGRGRWTTCARAWPRRRS